MATPSCSSVTGPSGTSGISINPRNTDIPLRPRQIAINQDLHNYICTTMLLNTSVLGFAIFNHVYYPLQGSSDHNDFDYLSNRHIHVTSNFALLLSATSYVIFKTRITLIKQEPYPHFYPARYSDEGKLQLSQFLHGVTDFSVALVALLYKVSRIAPLPILLSLSLVSRSYYSIKTIDKEILLKNTYAYMRGLKDDAESSQPTVTFPSTYRTDTRTTTNTSVAVKRLSICTQIHQGIVSIRGRVRNIFRECIRNISGS